MTRGDWKIYEDYDITAEVGQSLLNNENKIMEYSWKKGLMKALVSVVLVGLPMVVNMFPEWMNLTIGGLLVMLLNWVKVAYKKA